MLHPGNFMILGKQVKEYTQRTDCSNSSSRTGPLVPVIPGQDEEGMSREECHPQAGMEPASCWNKCSAMLPPCHVAYRASKALPWTPRAI